MNLPIALADCNNFYVSCERAINPALNGRPVVVLSNNDGCIISRSEEAKLLGIKMGEAFHLKKSFLDRHQVVYLSSNYVLYNEMSERVVYALREFSFKTEFYSIDEAFLEIPNEKNLRLYGQHIQNTIKQKLAIPISIGIAETKTLAKVANFYAKRSAKTKGVLNLTRSLWQDQALQGMDVQEVWGIGRGWGKKLKRDGIVTALCLKRAQTRPIADKYGVVLGRTVEELNGKPCIPVIEEYPQSKMIMSSLSFGQPITTLSELKQAVACYAADTAVRLRMEKLAVRTVYVFIQTNPYNTTHPPYFDHIHIHLPVATFNTEEIISAAFKGVDIIFKEGRQYHKAGVMLENLVPQNAIQLNLFHKEDFTKTENLTNTTDAINKLYGQGTIRYAIEGFSKKWTARRNYLSNTSALKEFPPRPQDRLHKTIGFVSSTNMIEHL